jgi:hypothetical protein
MKLETKILLALAVLVAYAFFTTVDVFAKTTDYRPDACHTFHVLQHDFAGQERTGFELCGESDKDTADNDTESTIEETAVTSTETKVKNDAGDPAKVKTNKGNHYGNDKPDNNSKDVKNPHNGENTYDEHHGHNGNNH